MEWTKNPPTNNTEISEWYWYYDPKHKNLEIIEIWPNRDVRRFDGYWWPEKINAPQKPEILGQNSPKDGPKKQKRGRPKGSKNKKKEN